MNSKELEVRHKLRDDFPLYCDKALKIINKNSHLIDFHLNDGQLKVHELLEEQKRKTGKVRAIILKARQMGISTYAAARFYHNVTHNKHKRAFILCHEQKSSDHLFDMVYRFHQHLRPELKPQTITASAKELEFNTPDGNGLDSGYKIGTAGNKESGRSHTINLLHWSEVAFSPNSDNIFTGLMQAVPDVDNTEIILESTANGISNVFYRLWCQAVAGDSPFMPIFLPWFDHSEYQIPINAPLPLDEEEQKLRELYQLTDDQLNWRRERLKFLLNDKTKFKQEYPATPEEAFETTAGNVFMDNYKVRKATKTRVDAHGPVILGVDPSGGGQDRAVIAVRQGRAIIEIREYRDIDTMEFVGKIIDCVRDYKTLPTTPTLSVNIEVDGLGIGVYDRFCESGFKDITKPVRMSERLSDEYCVNRRAHCYLTAKQAFDDEPFSIPDNPALVEELLAVELKSHSSGKMLLEPKDDLKKRLQRSPDLSDAVVLTFAFPPEMYKMSQQFDKINDYSWVV